MATIFDLRQTARNGVTVHSVSGCRRKGKLRDKFSIVENQGLARRISLSHNDSMKYGYARISTDDQNTALQLAALKRAGCKTIFTDEGISGVTVKCPALTRCLKALRPGDTLIVWKLDCLGRGLRDLITLLDALRAQGI